MHRHLAASEDFCTFVTHDMTHDDSRLFRPKSQVISQFEWWLDYDFIVNDLSESNTGRGPSILQYLIKIL